MQQDTKAINIYQVPTITRKNKFSITQLQTTDSYQEPTVIRNTSFHLDKRRVLLSLLAHSFLVLCSILHQIKVHLEFRLSYGNIIPSARNSAPLFTQIDLSAHGNGTHEPLTFMATIFNKLENYYPLLTIQQLFMYFYHISTVYLIKLEQVFSTTKSTQHYPEEI